MRAARSSPTTSRAGRGGYRNAGRNLVSRITRLAIAGSIAMTAAFSAVAAAAFSGHSSAGASVPAGSTTASGITKSHPTVALPPAKSGALPQPVQPPVVTAAAPPVTSGGS